MPSDQTTRDKKLILRHLIRSGPGAAVPKRKESDALGGLTMKHMEIRLRFLQDEPEDVLDRKFHVLDRKNRGVRVCFIVKKGLPHVLHRKCDLHGVRGFQVNL